ncbi:MAG: PIN domain-containing protein [Polyangiaceae bacterium]|nr:PIN domain-containing protein [Polyangiaceae bacterium]MCW5789104.1 PIN domain-containing protein [Polyangiaceae bacterium]
MNELTFDTGALIALERRRQRILQVLTRAVALRVRIIVPAAVVTEWWRGRSKVREDILSKLVIEPLSESIAKLAGDALAAVEGATAVDAMVMASAALRGGAVYTSDRDDLEALRAFFPSVRILSV